MPAASLEGATGTVNQLATIAENRVTSNRNRVTMPYDSLHIGRKSICFPRKTLVHLTSTSAFVLRERPMFRAVVCCMLVLGVQGIDGGVADDARDAQVALPLAVKKFVAIDEAEAFSFGNYDDALALATSTKGGQVFAVVTRPRSAGGKVLRANLDLENTPRLLMADLDGDARTEVLIGSKHLSVFRLGNDGLSPLWTSGEAFGDKPPPRLAVADFNGDGHSDIIVLNYKHRGQEPDNQSLYVYLNQARGDSSFRLGGSTTLTDVHGFHSSSGLTIGKFYGDEQPKIVVGNSNGWLWFIEVKDEKPVVTHSWKVPSGGAIGPGLAVGNLDGGAENELLVGTNGGDIFVYRPISAEAVELVARAHAGRLAYGVQSADIDRDGKDEFLLSRGYLGYANMTQKDVVTECWKLKNGKLRRIWQRQAMGFVIPHIMLKDLDGDSTDELLIYGPSQGGKGNKIEAIKPHLQPARTP